MVDDLAAHAGVPDYLDARDGTAGDVGDLADAGGRAARRGVDAVCHQAANGRPGRRLRRRRPPTWPTTTSGTAGLLAALHAAGFAGRLVLASSMVVYGEGRYRCAEHGDVRAGRRGRRPTSTPAASSRPARAAARRSAGHRRRGRAARPPQRLRRHQAPPGAPVRGLRARDAGAPWSRPALPQRLRAPDAPRHALRRACASIFRSAVERGRAPRGVRGRRPDPRLRPRRRRGPSQRPRPHRPGCPRASPPSTSPAARPARSATWPGHVALPGARGHRSVAFG